MYTQHFESLESPHLANNEASPRQKLTRFTGVDGMPLGQMWESAGEERRQPKLTQIMRTPSYVATNDAFIENTQEMRFAVASSGVLTCPANDEASPRQSLTGFAGVDERPLRQNMGIWGEKKGVSRSRRKYEEPRRMSITESLRFRTHDQ